MSIFERKRKNNLKNLTDALNDINKTLKKYNQDKDFRGENGEVDKKHKDSILNILKEYWFIISLLAYIYMLYIYIL